MATPAAQPRHPGERPASAGWWKRATHQRLASATAPHAARRDWSKARRQRRAVRQPGMTTPRGHRPHGKTADGAGLQVPSAPRRISFPLSPFSFLGRRPPDPTPLAGVGESDLWLVAAPPRACPPPAKRHSVNCTRVAAGGGWGEGERAAPVGRTGRFVRPLRVHPQPRVAAPAATRGSCPPKPRKPGDPACPTRPVRPTSRPSAARSRTPLGVQLNPGARQPGVFASLDPRLMSVTPTGVCVLQPPRRHQTTSRQPRPTCPTVGAPSTTNRSPMPRTMSTHELPRIGQRK